MYKPPKEALFPQAAWLFSALMVRLNGRAVHWLYAYFASLHIECAGPSEKFINLGHSKIQSESKHSISPLFFGFKLNFGNPGSFIEFRPSPAHEALKFMTTDKC